MKALDLAYLHTTADLLERELDEACAIDSGKSSAEVIAIETDFNRVLMQIPARNQAEIDDLWLMCGGNPR